MSTFLLICAAVAALWLLHRLALWAEERGWIYYLRKKGNPDTLGNAFLELQQMAEPSKKYVIEARREQHAEQDGEAGPGDPTRFRRHQSEGPRD